jgi:hypothetical protein
MIKTRLTLSRSLYIDHDSLLTLWFAPEKHTMIRRLEFEKKVSMAPVCLLFAQAVHPKNWFNGRKCATAPFRIPQSQRCSPPLPPGRSFQ